MEAALKRLVEKIPPPKKPRFSNVNWDRLEKALGLTYPSSFKDFIDVYGGSVWFDNVCPFFSEARTEKEAKDFVQSVKKKLAPLKGNTFDESFNAIEIPLSPADNGLFPFLIDYSGNLFCWQTDQNSPDKWPVVFWNTGPITILEKLTLAMLINDWLMRKPHMVKIWGDINEYEPDRIRLTE